MVEVKRTVLTRRTPLRRDTAKSLAWADKTRTLRRVSPKQRSFAKELDRLVGRTSSAIF